MASYLLLTVLVLGGLAFMSGRAAGLRLVAEHGVTTHSLPGYHGAFLALGTALPALLLAALWWMFQGRVIDALALNSLPPAFLAGATDAQRSLWLVEIRNIAAGAVFGTPDPALVAAAERHQFYGALSGWLMLAAAVAVMILSFILARRQLAPRFRARNAVELIVSGAMITCSVVAVLTTVGIMLSLLFEAIEFFRLVPPSDFFFGLRWEPQIAIRADQIAGEGAFGAIPLFVGTLLIAGIAMLVAAPIGIFSAIYLVEYADQRVRSVVKPILEILAGIPTVVYGFFAVLTVAPAIRQAGGLIGVATSPNSALAAGLVMGVMLIPFISSLSDDALRAVPRSMRDGSLAMGATRGETMTKVLVPAALPGIMGGVLLATSIAIGETMIVAMAAGLIARLTLNPLDSVTTVTVQIVTLLTGDTEFDSPKTLAAFGLGLVLFIVTLVLNVIALSIVRRFREQYE